MRKQPIVFSLVTSSGFVAAAIRQCTHSQYSHVEWLMPDGRRLGARADGVKIRAADYAKFSRELRIQVEVYEPQYRAFEDFMRLQLGKPYDFVAIAGFVAPPVRRVDWKEDSHWFCSELMGRGAELIGVYNGTAPLLPYNGMSPGDFGLVTRPFGQIIYER
jgi:hypothetical protein